MDLEGSVCSISSQPLSCLEDPFWPELRNPIWPLLRILPVWGFSILSKFWFGESECKLLDFCEDCFLKVAGSLKVAAVYYFPKVIGIGRLCLSLCVGSVSLALSPCQSLPCHLAPVGSIFQTAIRRGWYIVSRKSLGEVLHLDIFSPSYWYKFRNVPCGSWYHHIAAC